MLRPCVVKSRTTVTWSMPMVLGAGQVRFADSKSGIDTTQDVHIMAPVTDGAVALDWGQALQQQYHRQISSKVPPEKRNSLRSAQRQSQEL